MYLMSRVSTRFRRLSLTTSTPMSCGPITFVEPSQRRLRAWPPLLECRPTTLRADCWPEKCSRQLSFRRRTCALATASTRPPIASHQKLRGGTWRTSSQPSGSTLAFCSTGNKSHFKLFWLVVDHFNLFHTPLQRRHLPSLACHT